jgi:hypothetical protein
VEPQSPSSPQGVLPTGAAGAQGWDAEHFAAWLRDDLKFEALASRGCGRCNGGRDGQGRLERTRHVWIEGRKDYLAAQTACVISNGTLTTGISLVPTALILEEMRENKRS